LTASDGDTEGGAPVSVIEMAASGLPIVSTQHADIPNIIHHGQSGLLFPEKSPGLLATGLLKLIKNEPLYEKISRQARKQVLNLYNIRKTAKQLSNIYKQVIKNSD
jgi:colanic acid/amylovoran biosynthesis glycosyltransferase